MAQRATAQPQPKTTRPVVTQFFAKWLWSSGPTPTLRESVARQQRSYNRATLIVRVYYAVSVYWVLSATGGWEGYLHSQSADPLWPTRWWFDHVSIHTGIDIIFCAYIATSMIAALVPERRLARILYSFALLQYMAFVNTPDKVNHDLHGWLFVSIVLVFLPRGPWNERRRIADRQYFLTVVWAATLVLLFFYSLTGFWKVHDASSAFVHGHINGFDLSGFSYIVGQRLLATNTNAVLGVFFSKHALPGWALFMGTMYLEAGSVMVAFRPRLHRLWGLGLIFFHFGTQLAMGFTFPENVVLVGLLLVCSPFAPEGIDLKAAFLDLPLVHFASRRVEAVRRRGASQGSDPASVSGSP